MFNARNRGVGTLVVAIALASPALAERPREVSSIAAYVNGMAITKSEVGIMLYPQMKRLEARFPDRGAEFEKQLLEARNAVLRELTDRTEILTQPNLVPIKIDSKAIDEEVQREVRGNYEGSQDQFEAALRRNRMTREGFRQLTEDKLQAAAIKAREEKKK